MVRLTESKNQAVYDEEDAGNADFREGLGTTAEYLWHRVLACATARRKLAKEVPLTISVTSRGLYHSCEKKIKVGEFPL